MVDKRKKVDWPSVRERWENDPRQGYKWLIDEMGLDVTARRVGCVKKQEGWTKRVKRKSNAGAPTKYDPDFCEQARRLCLLGATNEELAEAFRVSVATIDLWIKKHIQFSIAIKEGRVVADARVAERLYQRAMGYEHDSEEIKVINDEVVRVPVIKHYPPDTGAAFIWLKNRRPQSWKDKVEIDQKPTIALVDKQALEDIYARALSQAEQQRKALLDRSEQFGQLIEHDDSA